MEDATFVAKGEDSCFTSIDIVCFVVLYNWLLCNGHHLLLRLDLRAAVAGVGGGFEAVLAPAP